MIKKIFFTCLLLIINHFCLFALDTWIRINQLGYMPESQKKAVIVSQTPVKISYFTIHDVLTGKEVVRLNRIRDFGKFENFKNVYILDFSDLKLQGAFYIKAGIYYSPTIYISDKIYENSTGAILNYFRQQRCTDNSHANDAFEETQKTIASVEKKTDLPKKKDPLVKNKKTNEKDSIAPVKTQTLVRTEFNRIDLTGGWHTNADLSKNGAIVASSVQNMLMAWQLHPNAFEDKFDAYANKTGNHIPDILDEAKWGLDWLIKTYSENTNRIFHQVGDYRDSIEGQHTMLDSVNRIEFKGRTAYPATGKPQGIATFNRSTGLASLAGKYAAAFALGADVFESYNKTFADSLETLSKTLYSLGKKYPGVTQSIPDANNRCIEEDNWTDDMELAAAQLYRLSFAGDYLKEAINYGRMEPVSPWVFADSVNYYQWFPFTNMGHIILASLENPAIRKEFLTDIKTNLNKVNKEKGESPFMVNIPMFRNSNNYIVSLALQCYFYRKYAGDQTFTDLENALTDWILGCNPWGVSMVIGWPEHAQFPAQPYSTPSETAPNSNGALISGAVISSEYKKEFRTVPEVSGHVNSDKYFYTDSPKDYLTNAPTFDGTASLLLYLVAKQDEKEHPVGLPANLIDKGAIFRTDTTKKTINLVFTGHKYSNGEKYILKALKRNNIHASFFVTGDFLKSKRNRKFSTKLAKEGNYVGPLSDKYLKTISTTNPEKLLVSKAEFLNDLKNNYIELEKIDVMRNNALIYYPPEGLYNDSISRWCRDNGIRMVVQTPGTLSSKDTSIPEMRDGYFSSIEIYNQIMSVEKKSGLNGYIIMFHTGTDKKRTDKYYKRLSAMISELKLKGYEFTTINESIDSHIYRKKGKDRKVQK